MPTWLRLIFLKRFILMAEVAGAIKVLEKLEAVEEIQKLFSLPWRKQNDDD